MSNQIRRSPRIMARRRALLQQPVQATVADILENVPSSSNNTTGGEAAARGRSRSALASTGDTTHTSLRDIGSRTSIPIRIASRASSATTTSRTTATTTRRRTASASRVPTRRSTLSNTASIASNVQEKALSPSIETAIISPFSDTSNLNSTRLSMCTTEFYCPICMMSAKRENRRILATNCGHVFCDICLVEAHRKREVCPICQRSTNSNDFRELFI